MDIKKISVYQYNKKVGLKVNNFRLMAILKIYSIYSDCGNKEVDAKVKEKEVEFKCECSFEDTIKG